MRISMSNIGLSIAEQLEKTNKYCWASLVVLFYDFKFKDLFTFDFWDSLASARLFVGYTCPPDKMYCFSCVDKRNDCKEWYENNMTISHTAPPHTRPPSP